MDDKNILTPEILDPEENEKKELQTKDRREYFFQAVTPYSHLPFLNKLRSIGLKSYRGVLKEATGLAGDLAEHTMAIERLKNIGEEIKDERLERELSIAQKEMQLRALKREAMFASDDDDIARLERLARKKELMRRIEGIEGKKDSKIKALKDELTEKLIKKEVLDDYELKKLKLRVKMDLKKEMAIDKLFNEVYDEHFQGKAPEDYTEDDAKIHDRFLELYESARDKE